MLVTNASPLNSALPPAKIFPASGFKLPTGPMPDKIIAALTNASTHAIFSNVRRPIMPAPSATATTAALIAKLRASGVKRPARRQRFGTVLEHLG
jgi:hypothetical protein